MTPPLKIIQWNARSLYKSKLQEFKYNLLLTNPHIVLLSETHWKDHYTAQFSAYQTFALNRPTQGGGVAILVKKNIQTSPLPLPQSSDIEAIGVTIKTRNNTHIYIISLYCPNGNSCRRGNIEAILNAPRNTTIIGGDLNAHSGMWEDGKPENNNGKIISKYLLNQSNLILATPKNLGTRPSHNNSQNSTIDLTFTSPALGPTTTIHLGPYWSSDHLPIIININTDLPPTQLINPNWRFNEEKWEEWNEEISKTLTTNKLSNATSPESAYSILYSSIIEASQIHFTPNRNALAREKPKPWWTSQCKKATSMVRRAYNKWRSSLLQSDKTELNRLEAIKKRLLSKLRTMPGKNSLVHWTNRETPPPSGTSPNSCSKKREPNNPGPPLWTKRTGNSPTT